MKASAAQIEAGLVAPMLPGHDALSSSEQTLMCEAEMLYDVAEKNGGFENWTLAWLQLCEATGRDPLDEPGKILVYTDIDRHCGHRLGAHEKDMEMRAFIQREGTNA